MRTSRYRIDKRGVCRRSESFRVSSRSWQSRIPCRSDGRDAASRRYAISNEIADRTWMRTFCCTYRTDIFSPRPLRPCTTLGFPSIPDLLPPRALLIPLLELCPTRPRSSLYIGRNLEQFQRYDPIVEGRRIPLSTYVCMHMCIRVTYARSRDPRRAQLTRSRGPSVASTPQR